MATDEHPDLVALMAERFNIQPEQFKRVIKASCGLAKATDEEFLAFVMVAHRYDLDPLVREIYAFVKKEGGIQVIVSVDGWFKLANRHPQYNGIEYTDIVDGGRLTAIKAHVYRKDRKYPTEVTEYMKECYRETDQWRKWPARMLRWKAAIQGLRTAFSFAGIVEPDEAERIEETLREGVVVVDHEDLPMAVVLKEDVDAEERGLGPSATHSPKPAHLEALAALPDRVKLTPDTDAVKREMKREIEKLAKAAKMERADLEQTLEFELGITDPAEVPPAELTRIAKAIAEWSPK